MAELRYSELPHGITCIDTWLKRPGLAACYLIRSGDHYGFIDTGTPNSVPFLLELLQRKNIAVDQVSHVMPTHVHLDHAGGTGALMQALPKARLVVHPRGARHMIDPAKLEAGALAVYGHATFEKLFGRLVPVDASRVIEAGDGYQLDFHGRPLQFIHTPGHARHHYVVHDSLSQGLFTGDTFGASYPELNGGRRPFIFPPTTPIQFEPQVWQATLDHLLALEPRRIYVTHYGMHPEPDKLAVQLKDAINEYVEIALDLEQVPSRGEAITQALLNYSINTLQDAGCMLSPEAMTEVLLDDMALNAQGLDYWLSHGRVA
ncbi:MAG: hypothetical protein RLZZ385_689 [Pseudomonadota bacterium]